MRLEALRQVNELAMNLAGDEKALRESMHPDVEKVTRGKAICLFRSLLEETRFPDMGCNRFVRAGGAYERPRFLLGRVKVDEPVWTGQKLAGNVHSSFKCTAWVVCVVGSRCST